MLKEERTLWVNAYREQRAYGGPEDGGWFYTAGTPLASESVVCKCDLTYIEYSSFDEASGCYCWIIELPDDINHHDGNCDAWIKYNALYYEYNHRDEYYPQQPGDDSELLRGESLSTGNIKIRVQMAEGIEYPQYRPTYS